MKPDRYGHCCKCHKDLLVPRVVGGKQIMMFTPQFDQTEFVLNNKSRMVVCMCKKCKKMDLHDPKVQEKIMESVKLGWDMEQGNDKRQPSDYQDLSILFHSEGIDDYVVQDRFKKINETKGINV